MAFELDHVFIRVSRGAPEAEHLVQFGLREGQPNIHPGQGTANRRFFFINAMLELLWVEDARVAQSDDTWRGIATLQRQNAMYIHKPTPFKKPSSARDMHRVGTNLGTTTEQRLKVKNRHTPQSNDL